MLSNNVSEYEKLRQKNIEENKKMLESLGLLRSFKPILEPIKKRVPVQKKPQPAVKRKFEGETNTTELVAYEGVRVRRSLRNKGIEPDGTPLPDDIDDIDTYKPKPPKLKRENYFGPPEGIPVGTHWETRMGCSADGVHRPTVAGIHGNENYGCYSIALSGGYEDDIDLGVSFTYTGSGGRDLKGTKANPKNLRTAPQSKDQTFTKMNLALSRNVETHHPVRVIRGYKCPSEFAPEYGYRYDGLYTVEKSWSAVGLSGFIVCKYILKRMEDQAPPPWKESIQIFCDTSYTHLKVETTKLEDNHIQNQPAIITALSTGIFCFLKIFTYYYNPKHVLLHLNEPHLIRSCIKHLHM